MKKNETNSICVKSFNCRGLRNKIKRQSVFNWLNNNSKAICLLQETHSCELYEAEWQSEFSGRTLYSHGTSKSRGVAILIPNNLANEIDISNVQKDSQGRLLALNCKIEKNLVTIINVYAPTKDNSSKQDEFINELHRLVERFCDNPLIIAGDFNICLDLKLDKKGGLLDETSNYRNSLLNAMEEYDLVDVWRHRNFDKRQYTWGGKG